MTNTNPPQTPQRGPSNGHAPGYPKPENGGPQQGQGIPPRGGADSGKNSANTPGNGRGSNNMPKPPKVGRPDGLAPNLKAAPEDVQLGVQAWLAVTCLQILYAIVQFFSNIADDRELRQSVTQALDEGPGIPADLKDRVSLDTLVMGTNALTMLWMIVAAVICAWLVIRAGRGAVYSRMFLNVGSVYLMITAVLLVFSSGPGNMPVGFVLLLGALTILSGVAAGLGMWFMSRPGNKEWFGIPSTEEFEKYVEKVEEQRAKDAKKKQDAKAEKNKGNH